MAATASEAQGAEDGLSLGDLPAVYARLRSHLGKFFKAKFIYVWIVTVKNSTSVLVSISFF